MTEVPYNIALFQEQAPHARQISEENPRKMIQSWVQATGYDGVRLMSQNCGPYGPIVHPWVICDVGPGMMIVTEANFQLVYQNALAAPSTVQWSCQQRHLWQPPVLSGGPAI
jgi:hypothetical protein